MGFFLQNSGTINDQNFDRWKRLTLTGGNEKVFFLVIFGEDSQKSHTFIKGEKTKGFSREAFCNPPNAPKIPKLFGISQMMPMVTTLSLWFFDWNLSHGNLRGPLRDHGG